MTKDKSVQVCFVIAPIGKEGTDIRVRADQVLKHILNPAANECGYDTIRADQISEPGLITSQVIQHVVDDPLVIADLTGWNPNVFYELSLRHALKKPVVQIIQSNETIPFDVAASRTIHVDHHDLDSAAKAKDEIVRQIKSVEKNPADVDTPISVAIELQLLRQSENPLEKSNAEILTMLSDIRSTLGDLRPIMLSDIQKTLADLREDPRRMRIHPGMVEELAMLLGEIYSVLDMEEPPEGSSRKRWEMLRSRIRDSEGLFHHFCMEAGMPPDMFMRRLRDRKMKDKFSILHDDSPRNPR
jgi:hypothetical protein